VRNLYVLEFSCILPSRILPYSMLSRMPKRRIRLGGILADRLRRSGLGGFLLVSNC